MVKNIALIVCTIVLGLNCSSSKSSIVEKNSNSNQGDFITEWSAVDSLDSKGLYQSALEQVLKIKEQAIQGHAHNHVVRALYHQAKYTNMIEEDGMRKAIAILETEEVAQLPAGHQAITQSVLAELYYQYASQNQYKIQGRTITEDMGDDIDTWSLRSIIKRSNDLYLSSVSNSEEGGEELAQYSFLIKGESEELKNEYSLQTLLMKRATDHFKNSRNLIVEPINVFRLTDPVAFADSKTFSRHKFNTTDTSSYAYQALALYQELENRVENQSLLFQLVIERLQFAHQIYQSDDGREQYRSALREIADGDDIPNTERKSATYQLALNYYKEGLRYQNEFDKSLKGSFTEAYNLVNGVTASSPKDQLDLAIDALMHNINKKDLQLSTELVYLPDVSGLFYIKYRNVDQVNLRLIKSNRDFIQELRQQNRQEVKEKLLSLTSLREWSESTAADDYNTHASELMLDPLELGEYILVASSDDVFSYGYFYISNLSYQVQTGNAHLDYAVTHRKTGLPLSGVKLTFYNQQYNSNKITRIPIGTAYTNQDGRVQALKSLLNIDESKSTGRYNDRQSIGITLEHQDDVLDLGELHYYNGRYDERTRQYIHVLSDRQIYRPGQTVHIKGIALEADEYGDANQIITNETLTLTLRDVNGKEIHRKELITNEYGSVNSELKLPQGGLSGRYSIELSGSTSHGYHSITVEEYKRPTFAVQIEQPDSDYKLGDVLSVSGGATLFSGVAVSGAQVRYRVIRRARYHHHQIYRSIPQQQAQEEIAQGQIMTDEEGKFIISFKLKEPSGAQDRTVYQYEVTADVTDISGETQSSSTVISASRQRLFLTLSQSGIVDVSELDSLNLSIKNIAGGAISMKGSYQIVKLMSQDLYKRPKYWGRLDTFLLSEAEYDKVPADYMGNDGSYENWAVEKEVAAGKISATGNYLITWPESERSGVYKLNVTAEDGAEETFYLRVNDQKMHEYTKSELLHFHLDQKEYKKGETATLTIASSYSDVNVSYEIEKRGSIIKSEKLSVSNTHHAITIPIAEDDIDFIIHISCVHQNRAYLFQQLVSVSQPEHDLDISIHSFRSTLLPGEKVEDWTIHVTDKNGKIEKAEIAASLYDASLDKLSALPFEWRDLTKANYHSNFRTDMVGFRAQYFSQIHDQSHIATYNLTVPHPSLNTYNILRLSGSMAGSSKMRTMSRSGDAGAAIMAAPAAEEETMMAMDSDATGESSFQVSKVITKEADNKEPAQAEWSSMRTNLQETVFFYPQLYSDNNGQAELKFTMGEALTKWKLQLFAHTPKAASGIKVLDVYTKKDIMIYPNVSRFARMGDKLRLSGKVVNLTDQATTATVELQLTHALSDQDLTAQLLSSDQKYSVQLGPNESREIEWWATPDATVLNGLIYRMRVEAGNQSDGEEGYLPVLTNQILVTESLPLYIPSMTNRSFVFEDLKEALSSQSAEVLKYSIEHVSNPAWYAVQALPYLSAIHNEGIAQLAERYFANQVGRAIIDANPVIKRVMDEWRRNGSDRSQLLKNQDLKSASIDETPWLRAALSETEAMQELSRFFDENQLKMSLTSIGDEIIKRQNADGGFSWFPGRRSNQFMTSQVLDNIAKLEDLNIAHGLSAVKVNALRYVDAALEDFFKQYQLKKGDKVGSAMLSTLFIRSSFASEHPLSQAAELHINQIHEHWTELNMSDQAMLALTLNNLSLDEKATEIYRSLQERELTAESKGTYWKHDGSWANRSAVDRQVLMIKTYQAMGADQAKLDELRTWLLVNKQANNWKSTSATTSAVYALLIDGESHQSEWLTTSDDSKVIVGDQQIVSDASEAGGLYFRKDFSGSEITPSLADIQIENKSDQINWGSAYVQYMEDIDKIESSASAQLSISKEIYKEIRTDDGPQLVKLSSADQLALGDKLVVKIICQTDRPIEYVHVKDYRASGTEPTQTLSQYKSQDGLSYYEVTKDLSTNFFISHMSRGTYVLEYALRVNLEGTYSSGIASIQCLYAPTLEAHSNSVNLNVGD